MVVLRLTSLNHQAALEVRAALPPYWSGFAFFPLDLRVRMPLRSTEIKGNIADRA